MKSQFVKIFSLFVFWRILLFGAAFLSVILFPKFGGRFPYYDKLLETTGLPSWIWGFGNFDGVHYLTIAKSSYSAEYSQAFFPLYPLIVDALTYGNSFFLTALLVSNIIFLISLFFLYRLYRLDYNSKTSLYSLVLLITFPSAFYFGSVYSESLFLLLTVLSFWFIRKKNFLLGGLFAALSTATKIFGIFLIPVLAVEIYLRMKTKEEGAKLNIKEKIYAFLGLAIAPLGILSYMLYLKLNFNNALYFLSSQPIFGAERTSGKIVLLPQVLYRYLKMLLSVDFGSIAFLNASLELFMTLSAFALLIIIWKKIRLSYRIFTLFCLLLPTLTGTLSSMPRYTLTIFLLLPFLSKLNTKFYWLLVVFMAAMELILVSVFVRGYWIA